MNREDLLLLPPTFNTVAFIPMDTILLIAGRKLFRLFSLVPQRITGITTFYGTVKII